MKKKNLKNLSIQKNTISQITGGANGNQANDNQHQAGSGFLSCRPEPTPIKSQVQTCQYSCIQSCYCL